MAGQDDLIASLQAIMAARLEEHGEPPTPEELLAYRDGRLSAEERQAVEDTLALDPAAARTLADLQAFPDVEPAPGTLDLSDQEVTARWQRFRKRLDDGPASGPEGGAESRSAPPSAAAAPRVRRWPSLRLAAAVVIGLGIGWAAGFGVRHASDSAINVQLEELSPQGASGVRSSTSPIELTPGTEELLLVLGPPDHTEREFAQYEAEILAPTGRRVWARRGLRPTALGTFQLSFRRTALPSYRYRIDLYARDGKARLRLASYDLQLLAEPKPR